MSYLIDTYLDMCQVCGRGFGSVICNGCAMGLRPAGVRLFGNLPVASAYQHSGPALRLVWALKYHGQLDSARFLAAAMVDELPSGAKVLVPVPRLLTRRLRYGVDPAAELAMALSRLTGLPVASGLVAPLVGRRRAGAARRDRSAPAFQRRRQVTGAVLVDDVVTTGQTLVKAAEVLNDSSILAGVTATGSL